MAGLAPRRLELKEGRRVHKQGMVLVVKNETCGAVPLLGSCLAVVWRTYTR